MNKWIPTSERLPEVEVEVLICTKNGTITTAHYEDGQVREVDSIWSWDNLYDYAYYDEEVNDYIIPEGWWEYRHYNPDEVYNNAVEDEVVAWMPLPGKYEMGD